MKKILAIAGTGRCGTTKLQTILKQVPGVYVEMDENDSSFFHVRMPAISDPSIAGAAVKKKLVDIETNPLYSNFHTFAVDGHVTGNNFIPHFVENGVIPNVFIVRRRPRQVAKSLYRLNWIPGRNPLILVHFNGPNETDVMPYRGWQTAHHYQLCFWYCCEIERRLRYVKEFAMQHNVPFCEMTLQQMLDTDYFNSTLTRFGLAQVEQISDEKVNASEVYQNGEFYLQDDPPEEYLEELELQVLDSIPVEDKDYILSSWKNLGLIGN